MSEPEELILEGAHFATRVARDLWSRRVADTSAAGVALTEVRPRLELFVSALFRVPIAIGALDPPAPSTWLSKLAHRSARSRDSRSLGATDGERVLLPPWLPSTPGKMQAVERYRLLAVQQAARLCRQAIAVVRAITDNATLDWLMLAEAAIVDRWIAAHAPGLIEAVIRARAEALAERRVPRSENAAVVALDRELRTLLASPPVVVTIDLRADALPQECGRWAEAMAGRYREGARYDRMVSVPYWGAFVAPSTSHPTVFKDPLEADRSSPDRPPRVSEMRRRPKPRESATDEDDGDAGAWVIRADDPQESVEDPLGLQRPADRDEQADPDGLGDSLSELPEARVVRTPQQAREVLRSGEAPRRSGLSSVEIPARIGIAYPEWDYRTSQYRQHAAIVRQPAAKSGDAEWVAAVLSRHGRLIRNVRSRFERLRPRPVRVYGQTDGPELDAAAYVTASADRRAGVATDGRLYVATHRQRRELVVALLVDVSASTDAWVSANRRIVDVEKEAMLVMCEALDALGDRYGIFAFSGEGPEDVSIVSLKGFEEPSTLAVRRHIAGLDCDRYTRLGTPIRHLTAALCRQPARTRLLFLLSDGKPNDVDVYDGRYGVEDTRHAVGEARRQGVKVFCLTVDREAPRYAGRIFGHAGFAVLHKPEQLPAVIVEVLRQLIRL